MWIYETPIGIMQIYKNHSGHYSLQINNAVYGFYHSAIAAADDVYMFATGCNEWDSMEDIIDPPSSIHEWRQV